jgi:hypothetical protein
MNDRKDPQNFIKIISCFEVGISIEIFLRGENFRLTILHVAPKNKIGFELWNKSIWNVRFTIADEIRSIRTQYDQWWSWWHLQSFWRTYADDVWMPSDPGPDLVQDAHEVQSVLLELDVSKGAGSDSIPPFILKNCGSAFARPFFSFNRVTLSATTAKKGQ